MNPAPGNAMTSQQLSQLPQQQQQQLASTTQINRFMPVNGTSLDTSPPARRGGVLPIGNLLVAKAGAPIQTFAFDPVAEQELHRQMDDFKKTVTIILWYKARIEPLRIQHTIRSFPFFELSILTSVVHDLRLADDAYLDTYIPESDQWMQHTIHTVRIVESQQRLLYRIRKNLLEGISAEDCASLPAELELQKQVISPKKHVHIADHRPSIDGGLPTPMTPDIMMKNAPEKNPRKRPASETDEFEQTQSQSPKVHIPTSFYLTPQNEAAASAMPSTSTSILAPSNTVDDENATGSVNPVNHTVSSSSSDYLYQSTMYYPPHPPTSANPTATGPQHHSADTSHLHASQTTTGTVAYQPHLPIKRWPNDYSVAEISAGFHEMDRLVAQTPNLTQRLAFERVFGTRYVKSTVCRHRGVWKRASRAMREQFIALGNDDRASWGEFVRTVEGRQSAKVGGRNDPTVPSSSHETIEFAAAGSDGGMVGLNAGTDALEGQVVSSHDSNAGAVEEPIMDSLQSHASGSSPASSLPNDLNVFDAALSHIPTSQV